jgi:murein L,D-transpeptidase YcbB/YkuD
LPGTSIRVFNLAFALLLATAAHADTSSQAALEHLVGQLRADGSLEIGESQIAAVKLIPDVYERRGYTPAWVSDASVEAVLEAIRYSYEQGLDPEDYHRQAIKELRSRVAAGAGPEATAELEILLTDAVVRLAYHASFGKVVPGELDPNWNFDRRLHSPDPVAELGNVLGTTDLRSAIREHFNAPVFYDWLGDALAHYRQIAAEGGWPSVPSGPTLKSGMVDERTVSLRQRLQSTGDLADVPSDDPVVFDAALKRAVITFQKRHGLVPDGAVGPTTLAALNVPVEQRIDQIRVNLERIRWVYRELPADYVIVDIAGFHVYLVQAGEIVWQARAQVGKPYRDTPVFRDSMKYLEFNPTWTVPPTILREDILPRLKRDPGYLDERNMQVLSFSRKPVDASTIDWHSVSADHFPYLLRQGPGPDNALGRVKFMFPNAHAIYIHDTPSKSLFARSERAFSSGCIRVERPFELAELVLNDPERWDQQGIQQLLDSRRTQRVNLKEPLPVLILYWTAEVDADGRVHFRKDVYGRDERVLDALDGDFRFVAPDEL